jgi:hypothetical protein
MLQISILYELRTQVNGGGPTCISVKTSVRYDPVPASHMYRESFPERPNHIHFP